MNNEIFSQDELYHLLSNYFNSEVSKIGKNSLEVIIEDFVQGGKKNINFETPTGGHNYDYVSTMSLIVGILQLIVASADYISEKIRKGENPEKSVIINYITINNPNEPINKFLEKTELLEEVTQLVKEKDDEGTK